MQLDLMGGFGEKGRTCVGIRTQECAIMLDAGIKVGAEGAEYYPALARPAKAYGALFLTHAHEDHVGAASWLIANGFRGPVFMTEETAREAPATLAQYAEAEQAARFPLADVVIFRPGDTLAFGDMEIETGLSGHVAGGVWFAVRHESGTVVHCGDVVPDSAVFRMDPLPRCDLVLLDASYGDDLVTGRERARAIAEWVAAHAQGSLLPTPLSGRSLELIAAMPGPFAIHHEMRAGLEAQLLSDNAFNPGSRDLVAKRLGAAPDWREEDDLPTCPLLCHDGMGTNGPSARLLPRAVESGHPILLTGHLPAGSPGALLRSEGRAEWIRMPTHPTLPGNLKMWEDAGRPAALGHSCPADMLEAMVRHIPGLHADCATGQTIRIEGGRVAP